MMVGAVRVRRKNRLSLLLLAAMLGPGLGAAALRAQDIVPASAAENSPREDLRQKLFKGRVEAGSCLPLGPAQRQSTDAGLERTLKDIAAAIKDKDARALQPLFHPRLNTSLAAIQTTYARMGQTYGAPFEISIFRLWAFNTVDGNPKGLECNEDGLKAFPLYGYPLQFGAWLQVMGQNELGRLYIGLVPYSGGWRIGAFQLQQWTHAGKDAAVWAEAGLKSARLGLKEAAFVQFDIAAKLLDGGGFMDINARQEMVSKRDGVLTPPEWDQRIRAAVKDHEVAYAASMLVTDGAGLLLRLRIPGEIALDTMKGRCQQIAQLLAQSPWAQPLAGVRCAFLLPQEKANLDGGLGAIYVPFRGAKG